MRHTIIAFFAIAIGVLFSFTASASTARYMEKLDRGLIAIKSGNGSFLSWRLFGTDPQDNSFGFNIYKGATKLNELVITNSTNYQDNSSGTGIYTVKAVTNGIEGEASSPAIIIDSGFLSIPLLPPTGSGYTETANDASVGDLDGDGQYEIVLKWDPSDSKDNSQLGNTGNTYLDGYKLNGTRLWRINMGQNIRSGQHYTQFLVYDFDGDGKAEIACKTAPGTIDGTNNFLKTGPAQGADNAVSYVGVTAFAAGAVVSGPEWYTVFSGITGGELATVNYKPGRYKTLTPSQQELQNLWGDGYGNRSERYLASVAYLDGEQPSIVPCRGYLTRSTLWALDFRNNTLTERWYFDSDSLFGIGKDGKSLANYAGQGCHCLRQGDIDQDGFDEIVYGACAIDHDGKGLYSTGLLHGDGIHLADMDPNREGLEVWQVHEAPNANGGFETSFRDAKTGQIIWGDTGTMVNGHGSCGPIMEGVVGWQMWSGTGGFWNISHTAAGNKPAPVCFPLWWDTGLNRAMANGTSINGYGAVPLLVAAGCSSNNGTSSTPCLTADIFGDWREEIVYRTSDNTALRIYSTTLQTTNRLYTLMHDPVYRMSVATENVGFNQPPEPGIYIGPGMTLPQVKPSIKYYDEAAPVMSGKTDALHSQTIADVRMKVFSDRSFSFPPNYRGITKCISIHDISGRLIQKAIVNKDVVNLQKEFGTAKGMYIVTIISRFK